MLRAPLALALLAPAAAQSLLYDAGPAGSPPVAPPPTLQNWTGGVTGSCAAGPLSPDPAWPTNAWQFNDPGPGSVRYEGDIAFVGNDFVAELEMMPLAGLISFELDSGDTIVNSLYTLQLEVVGNDVLIHHGGAAPIPCPGVVDGAYHTWTFSGFNFSLDVAVDGQPVGVVDETGWGLAVGGEGVRWGTFAGTHGRARVRRVEMTVNGWGPVGTTYCSPAVPNSTGGPARITAEQGPNLTRRFLRLVAEDLPPSSFAFFIVGSEPDLVVQAGGSQGTLCIGGNLGRYVGDGEVQATGALGRIWLDVDLRVLPTSPSTAVGPGETWCFQGWYRDANPHSTSNFTDAVSVTF